MSIASMRELLEAGVHFGHYTRRWHPKMRRYIFTERNGIHIIDLAQTVTALDGACNAMRDVVAQGGVVLFVGTKKQAAETVRTAAERVNMPYVTFRWLGGMLTNWDTMRQRVKYLLDLEARRDRGEFAMLPKKEALLLEREITKLNQRLGGIKAMTALPDMLFVVDTHRESIAVSEANKLGIRVAGMVDTNSDPDLVDFVIPANDDAIRAIKLIADKVADSVQEGMTMRESAFVEEMTASEAEAVDTSQRVFDPFEEETPAEAETEAEAAPTTKEGETAGDGPATGTKAPATEAPATDAPAADAPATDAPATDAPATDAPATDAPATDAPATDAPAPAASITEVPTARPVEAPEEAADAADAVAAANGGAPAAP